MRREGNTSIFSDDIGNSEETIAVESFGYYHVIIIVIEFWDCKIPYTGYIMYYSLYNRRFQRFMVPALP